MSKSLISERSFDMNSDLALGPPAQTPAPIMKADMRPTADTAALVRDPRPEVPLPIPASNGQSAAVTQSKVTASSKVEKTEAALQAERVLKPYGVAMLPESFKQPEPKEDEVAPEKPAQEKPDAKQADTQPKPENRVEKKPPEPMLEASSEEPTSIGKKAEPEKIET